MTVLVCLHHGEVEVRGAAPDGAHAVLSLDDWILRAPEAGGQVLGVAARDAHALAQRWAAQMRAGFVASDAALLALWDGQGPLSVFGWGREDGSLGSPPSRGRQAVAEPVGADDSSSVVAVTPSAVVLASASPVGPASPSPVVPAKAGTQGVLPRGLYAIVDSVSRLRQVLDAGIRLTQLRIKTPRDADATWFAQLRTQLRDGIRAANDAGATLYVNDHWRLAAELGGHAVHLGQEDLLALGEAGRAELAASGLALGVSSHAVWELCRGRSLQPAYIACGPVWPTTTKDMPWRPQGLDNLGWWVAQAGAPVVAIGGILEPEQVRVAARAGAGAVCLVRGLGDDPRRTVPVFQGAFDEGPADPMKPPPWPHPSLEPRA